MAYDWLMMTSSGEVWILQSQKHYIVFTNKVVLKMNADGSVKQLKARFLAQGLPQKFKIDYDERFCLVVGFESV